MLYADEPLRFELQAAAHARESGQFRFQFG
jgi:hypothetical protein